MADRSLSPGALTFGSFEFRPGSGELLKRGRRIKLQHQSFQILSALLARAGEPVSREELRERLWKDGTNVEFEHGLNAAIRRLRDALGESAGKPRFIETLPRLGYRFIAPVNTASVESWQEPESVRLAVLPFELLDPDSHREYLADGLTEEVIAALGQIGTQRLAVIGRTSMMTYKRTAKPLAEIAQDLNAAYLVESSIRTDGGRVRITSRLIRARDQVQIWSESFDDEPQSVLDFQRELSLAIARAVHLRLSPERLQGLAHRQTRHVEAYDLYLHGRYFFNQLSPRTTRQAIEFYTRATELDPMYALAWCGIADAWSSSPINGDAPALEVWPRARQAVQRAMSAEPDLSAVQCSLGFLKFWLDWDWKAAEAAFRRATLLDPGNGLAHRTLAIVLSYSGKFDEAMLAARRAREQDPLDHAHFALSSQVAFFARDYPTAVEFAARSTVLNPQFWVGYLQLAQAYEQLGKTGMALDALEKAGQLSGGNSKVFALRGYLFAKDGREGDARDVLHAIEANSSERYVPPSAAALVHVGLGDFEHAVECLNRAYEVHDVHLSFLCVDPKWDVLSGDDRVAALIERCGFQANRT